MYIIDDKEGLLSITDPNGNLTSFGPSGEQSSTGASMTIARDSLGRVTSITDPNGGVTKYGYDFYGDLVTVTDPMGNVTTFTYDTDHTLLEIYDPLGRQGTRNEYDASGRLIESTDAEGNRIEYSHNLGDQQEVTTDRLGNVTIVDYNTLGQVTSRTNASRQHHELHV